MAVDLKLVLGTVNYADYLRVSAAKVSNPGTEVFVTYINTPITNYTLIIPGLDPVNYYISFRDAPDTMSIGTLVSQAFVNAQTGEWLFERRFYTIGGLPGGVSVDAGYAVLTDPYLENRNVSGVFKEGFRYLELDTEYEHDDAAGTISLLNQNFSDGEKFIVEIKYNTGTNSTTASSLFTSTITVTGATYTVDALDKGKRFMLDCSGPKQEITLCPLSSIAQGDIVYFEHKRGGLQAQSRIKANGTDKILYNGLNIGTNELTELWVAKGESLYLRKEDTYWEVIFDYAGVRVGHRMAATFLDHPNYLPEDGRLLDGDEYPALYWWIQNVLPSTHKITDDTVVTGGYTHPAEKPGLFVVHSTLKKFRLPNTQALSEKGLLDFDSYGADADRLYDYPGGKQNDQNKAHDHKPPNNSNGTDYGFIPKSIGGANKTPGSIDSTGSGTEPNVKDSPVVPVSNGGAEVQVRNFGVIYLRRI